MPDTPPAPPSSPPAPSSPSSSGPGPAEGRLDKLEAEQTRQAGMLEQILAKLSGGGPAPSSPSSASAAPDIATMVREGIAELEARRQADADRDSAKEAREDAQRRLAALEERVPAEREDSVPGRLRAGVQRVVFGIETPSR